MSPTRPVWIDLENSPHVVFFAPWIAWLRERGHPVLLTARDLSQTLDLLRMHNLPYEAIGGHAAGGVLGKGFRSIRRAAALARWARGRRIVLALGHGSRAQALAAAATGIPALTFVDYEFVSLRLFGLTCRQVFFPDAVSADLLGRRGIPRGRLVRYPGFKEQVYLETGEARSPESPPLVVVRPPARRAHYHTERSERLYRLLLDRLASEGARCRVVLLPRYRDDEAGLRALAARHRHFEVPAGVVDGRSLLLRASLVASGGGTMVREAAILGVPSASYFGGPVGGVDRRLAEVGRLTLLRAEEDVRRLPLPAASSSTETHVPPDGPLPPAALRANGDASPSPGGIPPSTDVRRFLQSQVEAWLTRR